MLICKVVEKIVQADDFNEGYVGNPKYFWINYELTSPTIAGIKSKLAEFCNTSIDDIIVSEYEDNRIDVHTFENKDGREPSSNERFLWEQGKCKLYSVYYVCYVYEQLPYKLEN